MDIGKILVFTGLVLVILGVLFTVGGKIPFFGKLPGDILVKRDGFTFYFPIVTSILLSVFLTFILNFFTKR